AADFDVPATAEIVNPDLHIATLAKGGRLVMEVRVERGTGYVPAEIHSTKDRINSIPVDAVYTPVRRVAYRVEDTRVGQRTDLDRLLVRVWTDGSVDPRTALDQAVDTLRSQLAVFNGEAIEAGEEKAPVITIPAAKPAEEPTLRPDQVVLSLESLDLASRVLHSLQEEGIDPVNALLALSERDLKKVGGVGDKSPEEIKERLAAKVLMHKEQEIRHVSSDRKLSRSSSHRTALARSQATALLRHGRIKTTLSKAKILQPYVEKLITTARGGDLHARRLIAREIHDRDVQRKLMDEVAPAFADRPGGYTRIMKLVTRRGDGVQEALIELVTD